MDPVGETLGQWSLIAGLAMLTVGLVLLAISYESFGSTVPFVGALLVLVAAVGLKWLRSPRLDAAPLAFVALMVGTSLSLVVGLDFLRVEGDIDRMNSIFKFYLQVWVMLAVASAYMLWRLGHGKRGPWWRLPA